MTAKPLAPDDPAASGTPGEQSQQSHQSQQSQQRQHSQHGQPGRPGTAGDFEEIYRQQAPRIYSLACRMAGSPEDGEDLLQEIFLQAYRKMGSFKGDSTIGTWLYRLALNHCLDYVRSRQAKMRKMTESIDAQPSMEPTARRSTPIARIDLDRAIERLPNGCREAFVLHDVEGLDHKEVADALGIAEGTSKSQVFKARLKLRAMLK
jgi:RNA polymerase sigma-70 factor (ECF subfamily)